MNRLQATLWRMPSGPREEQLPADWIGPIPKKSAIYRQSPIARTVVGAHARYSDS